MRLRALDEALLPAALAFLRRRRATSLFLLGNLADHGPRLGPHPNSANFKVLLEGERVVAVFALARRGNLLVQSEAPREHAAAILEACAAEELPLRGVLGEWENALALWERAGLAPSFRSREVLYRLGLAGPRAMPAGVRRLVLEDFAGWRACHEAFLAEAGLPASTGSEAEQREVFALALGRWWGCFEGERLVSMAALNARADGVGQVGGVYTPPEHRRRGLSRRTLEGLMADVPDLQELVLFTGEDNTGAQALYEGLGFERIGHFGIFFGV